MAMGTPSPSDNTVTLSTTAVAGSGETLPMAANTIRDHTQDRTTYAYDTNGEYNRSGNSRSEMLPKTEQARSRSYHNTHGKPTVFEQVNRGEGKPSIRSESHHERSSPQDEQLTGQEDWRGEHTRQQTNQHPSTSSSSQSARQLVHLPPIRTQPPSSFYENGYSGPNGSGARQRTHSTPHPLQLQHVLNSTPSPTSTTASTSASVSTSSTSYLMTPISHVSSSSTPSTSALPNARSPSTPVRRSPSSISKVLNTNQDVPTMGSSSTSNKHRTSPSSSPLLSHHLPYHHHPALSNSSPITTPTNHPTPTSALSPTIATPRPTATQTFLPSPTLAPISTSTTNAPSSAAALASLERYKPLLQRSFPPSNPHTQHLYALAVQIVTSDWFLTQSMEPPLDTNDPLVMYEKILRPGESRFRAFLEMTAQRSYRCQFVLPGDNEAGGTTGGEDVEMADGEGDQDVCCRRGKRCERTEERLDRAQGHARQHFEYRPFVCGGKCARPDCTQRFYSSGQKDDHIRRSIPRRKECEACGKQISIQNVSRHMKVIHNQTVVQEKSPPTYKPY